ncbi:MAG: extensin family protein [Alphaproteobacteria bacterium]
MGFHANHFRKGLLVRHICVGLFSLYASAYAASIPGLDEIFNEIDEANTQSATTTSNNVPNVQQNADGSGSVFIFPLPLDKVDPAPSRPTDVGDVPTTTTAATGNNDQILTIISEDEINKLLGDAPLADNGPDHQVVRIAVEHVPTAPARPLDSILDAIDSQPVVVDAPDNLTQGILLASSPNPALKGTSNKIVIQSPPPRPNGLRSPSSLKELSQDDIVVANASASSGATVTSSGSLKVRYKRIRYQKIDSCSVRNVRNVTGVGQASILPAAIMKPDFSVKMARFERDVLQPAARKHYGVPVTQIKQISSYRCTNIAGTRTLSEHTKANALDVSSFVFADGRSVNLIEGWRGSRRERKFLRDLQAGACNIFGTTLTPNYNKAHYNHFHFDDKARKSKNICK